MTTRPTYEELEQRIRDLEKERMDLIRVEGAVKEGECKWRAIFDQTYQFIGLMAPDGTLMEANRAALEFSGARESDVIGKPFWEAPWWTHSEELQERLREAVLRAAAGEFVRFEATHRAKDGGLRNVDFSLKPVTDESGKVVFLIPEGRDITDRKLMEEALRKSELRVRELLNATMDSALLLDPDSIVLAINDVAAERIGSSVKGAIGRSIFDFTSERLTPHRRMAFRQAIESHSPVRFEDSSKGGTWDHNLYPILDTHGEVLEVAIYSRDITDFKLAVTDLEKRTQDLMESEGKYRTLVENIPLVVYRIDPAGQVLFVNRFIEEMIGYTPLEVMTGMVAWEQVVNTEDWPLVEELRRKSLREGKEFIAEYRVRHRNGSIVYVTDHAIPIQPLSGPIHNVDGFIMDVTGMKQLQEELVRAEELKTINEVSARLAHEIRNPLVSVGGFARRILSSLHPDDPNRNRVEIIVKESDRMEAILRMILRYIQPLELTLSPTGPNTLIETALGALESEIAARSVRLHLQLDRELPRISLDRPQMEHMVEVLVRAALHQMTEGAVLSISTSKENEMFNLFIRYPAEMPPDEVENFFYPFKWTETRSAIDDLPFSKILVEKHGGTIGVRLGRSGELTVHMTLPI